MNRYDKLMARIEGGEQIVIDGATGTEIERRGVPQLQDAWNGGGALSHPNILRQVHEDYILAGAQIIISNTFATLKTALRDAGVEKEITTLLVSKHCLATSGFIYHHLFKDHRHSFSFTFFQYPKVDSFFQPFGPPL